MLINQDFTQDRSKYIGGSDIGAILGLSPYRTPLEVWMEKTGKSLNQVDSLPLRFGAFAEAFVASEYSRATGFKLAHDQSTFIHPQYPYMRAHIDRLVLGDGADSPPTRLLECKTASPFTLSNSGEAKSDQVPMSYLCQCIWYMAIADIDKTDLAVLFGNSDFRIFEIARDAELESLVINRAIDFWENYVLKDIPPSAQTEADCQALFKNSDPEKIAEANEEVFLLLQHLSEHNIQIALHEKEVGAIKQVLMQTMGHAETLSYQGQILATWKAPKQSYRIDAKRLEADYPQIACAYKQPIQNNRRLFIKEHLTAPGALK